MELNELEEIIRKCWCKETSADMQNWTEENPAWGQCAVTALVVNDYFGGKLLWAEAELPDGIKISHYFNEINGYQVDFTSCQFPEETLIPKGIDKTGEFPTTRDRVLSFEPTKQRYSLLKSSVAEILAKEYEE